MNHVAMYKVTINDVRAWATISVGKVMKHILLLYFSSLNLPNIVEMTHFLLVNMLTFGLSNRSSSIQCWMPSHPIL